MSAVAVRKPSQESMLADLAKAVDLDNQSPEARQAHARLKASIWTEEDKARGRQIGSAANQLKAQELRVIWRKVGIRTWLDYLQLGRMLRRGALIENIHTHCVVENIKGKGGGTIQRATISRWLTEEVEEEIWRAAQADFIASQVALLVAQR